MPVRLEQPSKIEMLQMADLVASTTWQAFERAQFGNVERRYVTELAPRLHRYPGSSVTKHGIKLHPRSVLSDPDYAWVEKLQNQERSPAADRVGRDTQGGTARW
jgi:hypothetical protein